MHLVLVRLKLQHPVPRPLVPLELFCFGDHTTRNYTFIYPVLNLVRIQLSYMEPSLSLTPLTSVSKSNLSAFNAAAIAPDTVSPFIFKVSPSMPEPSGAIRGSCHFQIN